MKSETLIKISESRKKYFSEITQAQTEKKAILPMEPERQSLPSKKQKIDTPSLWLQLAGELNKGRKLVKRKVGAFAGKVWISIKQRSQVPLERLNRKAEKVRERFFSFLLVLFDA